MRKKKKASYSLKERFSYWFDNRMAKGSLGFIRILIAVSVVLAVLIAGLIILLRFNEEGEVASVFWDSIATVINAWMPSFEDGSPGYLILMSITAIAGVLFTSVLIGIITSTIEEKIVDLKKGNSIVLERDHLVVLGFNQGEYTLISQLILAAEGKSDCIVLADAMEREEMERLLDENLDIPKNFRIVCRTADITDPASIEKCSIETSRAVIISPIEDKRAIKCILAVSALMQEKQCPDVRVNVIISKKQHRIPPSIAQRHNITTLQINEILAKMIAHSCTQMGLSETLRELFNFEGSEFYLMEIPEAVDKTFENLMLRLDGAVPAGVLRGEEVLLNPDHDFMIRKGDRVLVFAEQSDSARLEPEAEPEAAEGQYVKLINSEDITDTVIMGHNETLPVILRELPESVTHVILVNQRLTTEEREELDSVAEGRDLIVNYYDKDPHSEKTMLQVAQLAEHVVILGDHDKSEDDADMEAIFLLLNLNDIRTRYDLNFNITVELQKEHNHKLVSQGDYTDFLVSSNMSSLFLAQLAERPELVGVFREILSNEGNELYLKNVGDSNLAGTHTVRELRKRVLRSGYILLGFVDSEKRSTFNHPLDEVITLPPDYDLIVLGKD